MTENTYTIESAAISDKGLSEKRPQNEDSYLEMRAQGLFAVADGVGGSQAGEVASQMAVEILSEAFNNLKSDGDAEEMMRVAIERANEAIYQMSHDLAQLSTMATTIVALHVANNIASIGHVGDSRLYRLDSKGNLFRETQDHSVIEEEVRAGRMTETQAVNHPSRNIISRALGAESSVEVDMKTIMFEPNTTFLLCSDGITRHIGDGELRSLLASGKAPANIAQEMKEICYERGAQDNLTAVIVKSTDEAATNLAVETAAGYEDYEEATVATARDAATPTAKTSTNTAPLEMPAENFQAVAPTPRSAETNSDVVASQTVPLVVEKAMPTNRASSSEAAAPVERMIVETAPAKTVETYVASEDAGSGGKLRRILSALLWLIIGGLAGAGLYHLFERNNPPPEPAPVLVQQSDDINLTSFERNRRNVDRDPQAYLASSAVSKPEDAEDFYLLGRANLYSGNFAEARQMFLQARDRLAEANEVNNKVLAHDIETGIIIVEVPFAQDAFKKTLNSTQSANQSQTNANVNQASGIR